MATMHFQGPGFQMQVPTDWQVTSSPQFQVMFIAPGNEAGLRANLMITMRQVQPDVTVADVSRLAKEAQASEYAQFEVIDEGEMPVSGVPGFQRLYRWFNQAANTDVLQRQVMVINHQVLFTVTASRAVNEESKSYDKDFAGMIDSFQFV